MEIFHTFGINIYLLVAEIVNFLIILYILKRFLYKPVFKMLKKREEQIKQGLQNAEEGKQLLANAEQQAKDIHKKATQEASRIIAEAKSESHFIIADTHEQAKKQTDIMRLEAREETERTMREMEKRLMQKISNVMAEFVKKSTDTLFGEKEQEQLVSNAVKQFKKLYE